LATAVNFAPIPLPGEAQLFLGPFVCMPLVLALRLPWSVLAAAVPMAATIPALGHPFVFLAATIEALWLGVAQRFRRGSPVVHDAAFWVAIGVPLLVALYCGVAQVPVEVAAIATARQVFNQFAALALAVFFLRHTRFGWWIDKRAVFRRRMRDIVFHSVFVLAMVPLMLVGVGVSVLLHAYCQREDREVLLETCQAVTQQLDLFLRTHEAVVTSAANTLSRTGEDPTALLDETRRAHPAIVALLVADADGRIVQTVPVGRLGAAAGFGDRAYFQAVRDSNRSSISGAFRRPELGRDAVVAISAPLHGRTGMFAGSVEALINVQRFASLTLGASRLGEVELIVADAEGRVVFADASAGVAPLVAVRRLAQAQLLDAEFAGQPLHFDKADARGLATRFTAYAVRSPQTGVVVIAQRPLLAGLDGSLWVLGLFGGVAVAIVVAAAWVARTTRTKAAEPLEFFAGRAMEQAALRNVEPIASRFPNAPYEVWIVFRAFHRLAVEVRQSYARLRQTNAELDRRVIERTNELENARQQAEAANRSKSDFVAMTSHEIRTPLNAIVALADVLADSATPGADAQRARTIRDAGRRLLEVVNDLLDLSRVEAGRLELRSSPLELGALCEDVRLLFELPARQKGLQLAVELDVPRPLWVETDANRLQQVLVNLIGNALKFTQTGRVVLRVEQREGSSSAAVLRFAVADTGPGIPRELQAKLFQPYVQLPNGEQASAPGTGLGLFISRRIVDLFGGRLVVRSEAGEGAEFSFTLTLRRAQPRAPATDARSASPTLRGLRVLAVDDNLANQEVLRSMLERHCATVTVVGDAATALAELSRAEYDGALVDLEMPDMDGIALARAVRAWVGAEASRGVHLIACSAHGRDRMWTSCAASGFDDFVEKPIDRRQLAAALGAVAASVRA
jgi:signal transduction histidine kinase